MHSVCMKIAYLVFLKLGVRLLKRAGLINTTILFPDIYLQKFQQAFLCVRFCCKYMLYFMLLSTLFQYRTLIIVLLLLL